MQLYHYVAKGNTVLTDGILSFAQNPHADLAIITNAPVKPHITGYVSGWNGVLKEEVVLSELFSEPIQYTEKVLICLSRFIENADLFAI